MKLLCAAAIGLVLLSRTALASGPQGSWLSETGDTKVKVSDCGGKLCGTVVWLGRPVDATGKPKTDKLNPDPAKRSHPLLGLLVVRGLSPSGPDKWSGTIYNADDGNIYQASMTVQGDSKARVQGCVLGILCKSHTWTRTN